jgi:hypothetical protein
MAKIKLLEEEVCKCDGYLTLTIQLICSLAQLKLKLQEQHLSQFSRSVSPPHRQSPNNLYPGPSSPNGQHTPDVLANASMSLPQAALDIANLMATDTPEACIRNSSGSPELHTFGSKPGTADPFMDLLFSGWNPDLPDPPVLNH